jgi:Arc/MetJ family transcription regulator
MPKPKRLVPVDVECNNLHMPTNLSIDDRLLGEAQTIGGHKTKRETVNEALREYIQRRKQAELLNLFGKVDFDPAYNHKRQRKRK